MALDEGTEVPLSDHDGSQVRGGGDVGGSGRVVEEQRHFTEVVAGPELGEGGVTFGDPGFAFQDQVEAAAAFVTVTHDGFPSAKLSLLGRAEHAGDLLFGTPCKQGGP